MSGHLMEFGDTLVQFNIFEAMKHTMEDTSLFGIDLIDEHVEEHMQVDTGSIEFFQSANQYEEQSKVGIMPATHVPDLNQVGQQFPDQQQPHREQEEKLLQVLKQHKKAVGWKLSDLPRINPSIFMHRILMEEEARLVRQQQRRLNQTILDVVKKEVTKLLTTGIIYPISDSNWVSLVQVVPKKSGMTIMKNQNDELVLTRVQNRWQVCIDYMKLNQVTRKDHFPLPFLNQVLEKLAGKSYYYFLDGYSGYMQIHIMPKDQ
ncbi:hypothetical protein CR513_13604, partial [Mucuna pruriens]